MAREYVVEDALLLNINIFLQIGVSISILTFFINLLFIDGAQPTDTVRRLLAKALIIDASKVPEVCQWDQIEWRGELYLLLPVCKYELTLSSVLFSYQFSSSWNNHTETIQKGWKDCSGWYCCHQRWIRQVLAKQMYPSDSMWECKWRSTTHKIIFNSQFVANSEKCFSLDYSLHAQCMMCQWIA